MWTGWLSSLFLSFNTRLEILLFYCILGGSYLYYVASFIKPGTIQRMLASGPILLGNIFVPFIFDPVHEVCTAMSVVFLLTWLGTFKVRQYEQGHISLSFTRELSC